MKIAFSKILLTALLLIVVSGQRQRRSREENERDITPDEILLIEEDVTIVDDADDLEKKAMMEEWDEHMNDFVPEDMLTFELNPREEISLHEFVPEDLQSESLYIRGAYFVNAQKSGEEKQLIDFFILDPNYQVIYSRRGKDEGIFRFNAKEEGGQYTFVFSNMKDKITRKSVTVAIHPGYDTDEAEEKASRKDVREMADAAGVPQDDITSFTAMMGKIHLNTKYMYTETKMSMIR